MIEVRPLAEGWRVAVAQVVNDMVFSRRRDAERAALRLAQRLADAGLASEVSVFLRDGCLAARFVCHASLPPNAPAPAARVVAGEGARRRALSETGWTGAERPTPTAAG